MFGEIINLLFIQYMVLCVFTKLKCQFGMRQFTFIDWVFVQSTELQSLEINLNKYEFSDGSGC